MDTTKSKCFPRGKSALCSTSIGQWTELILDRTIIATGLAPASYQVTTGTEYTASVDNYQQYVFDHWEDGSTDSERIITLNQDTTITAFFHP